MEPGCENADGGDYWLDYDLGRHWSTFTATVGALETDPSDASATYTVYGDGERLASGNVSLTQARNLRISVKKYLRLRLLVNDPQAPNRSCGFSDNYYYVWGNAQLSS
jgi:hypothetical protein